MEVDIPFLDIFIEKIAPWLQAGAWASFLVMAFFMWRADKAQKELATDYRILYKAYNDLQEKRAEELIKITTVVVTSNHALQTNTDTMKAHDELLRAFLKDPHD